MGSWANLLLLISLTEQKSWQACHVLSPLQPKTEYNVCSTQGNMINYTEAEFKNTEVLVYIRDVLYTSTPRQQLPNQIADNLCIYRFCAKLYNLQHLLHYAFEDAILTAYFHPNIKSMQVWLTIKHSSSYVQAHDQSTKLVYVSVILIDSCWQMWWGKGSDVLYQKQTSLPFSHK